MKIRGSAVSLSFFFPHPPEDKTKQKQTKQNKTKQNKTKQNKTDKLKTDKLQNEHEKTGKQY